MSAGPFLADRLITWLWPWGRRQLDALPHRRQIFLWIIVIGVFWSGFSAWREERGSRLAAETERNEAQRELVARRGSGDNTAELQQKLAEAEAKINHFDLSRCRKASWRQTKEYAFNI